LNVFVIEEVIEYAKDADHPTEDIAKSGTSHTLPGTSQHALKDYA